MIISKISKHVKQSIRVPISLLFRVNIVHSSWVINLHGEVSITFSNPVRVTSELKQEFELELYILGSYELFI